MQNEGMAYPIHLGVTEAGEGEDGRIRSAAGIGALLQDGIGDTIRVSLSEDPEKEIPVAKKLAEFFPRDIAEHKTVDALNYVTPDTKPELFRGINGPLVLGDFRPYKEIDPVKWISAGFRNDGGKISRTDSSADLILADFIPGDLPPDVRLAVPYKIWLGNSNLKNLFPLFEYPENGIEKSGDLNVILAKSDTSPEYLENFSPDNSLVIFSYKSRSIMLPPIS